MNLHFTFSIREVSQVRDSEQRLKIPMYFSVEWEVRQSVRPVQYRDIRRADCRSTPTTAAGRTTPPAPGARTLRRPRNVWKESFSY